MNLDFDKITELRKQKGLSVIGFCNLLGINRSTLWFWKNKKVQPSENKIRKMAQILGVSVEIISDLKDGKELSAHDLIKKTNRVGSFLQSYSKANSFNRFSQLHNNISSLENDLNEATIIINALLKSLDILIYIKDKNLKYITASKSFLKNLNLNNEFKIYGKQDEDVFSLREAKINHEQDKNVIKSGTAVMEEETYIPGSRKKKWSIVSKYPLFDSQNRVIGLIGTFTDITKRKKDEDIMSLLKKLLDTLTSVSIIDSSSLKFIYGNEKVRKDIEARYNVTMEEFTSKPGDHDDEVYPGDLEKFRKESQGKAIFSSYFRIIEKDKSIKWYNGTFSVLEQNSKKYRFAILRHCDKEIQIINENTIFRRIINKLSENSKNIIWSITAAKNKGLKLSFLNRNFEKVTGYSAQEFIEGEKNIESIIPIEYQHIFSDNYDKNREIKFQLITSQNKNINLTTSVNKELFPGLDDIYYGEAVVE